MDLLKLPPLLQGILAILIGTAVTVTVVRRMQAKMIGLSVYAVTSQRVMVLFSGEQESQGYAVPLRALQAVNVRAALGGDMLVFNLDRSALQLINVEYFRTRTLPIYFWYGLSNPYNVAETIENARAAA